MKNFVGDARWEVDRPDDSTAVQRHLDRLEEQAGRNLRSFNEEKEEALHLGRVTWCSWCSVTTHVLKFLSCTCTGSLAAAKLLCS